MLLNENIALAVVKEVGEKHIVVAVNEEEYCMDLEQDMFEELQVKILEQDNLLIPFNIESRQLYLYSDKQWNEETMEELIGASDSEVYYEG